MSSLSPASSASHASGASPSNRGGALTGRLATLLTLLAAGLFLWPLSGFSGNYDEGVYWQSLRAMAAGHPLFTSVFSSQPPVFLLGVYPFFMAFGQTISAARVGIAFFALVGVVAMYWLASEVGGRWAGLIAAALLIVDPHYLAQAHTLEAEGPAVAIEILAVALAVAASRREGRWRMALAALAGAALALGALIKLLDIVALVPIALYLGAPLLQAFDGGEGRVRWPPADDWRARGRAAGRDLGLVAAGAIVAALIALAPFLGSLGALWDQVVAFHLAAAHTERWSLSTAARLVGGALKWLGVPAALALGAAYWRRDWRIAPPLLWLLATIAVLVRQVPLFDHHLVIIAPCLALMVGLAPTILAPAVDKVAGRWLGLAVALVGVAVFAYSLYAGVRASGYAAAGPSSKSQTQIAAISAFTTPGEIVVTDDQYTLAQADHSVPPNLVDTSAVRIGSGYLTAAQIERIIERDHIRVIVLGTGRLTQIPGFMPWLRSHFALAAHVDKGYDIYIRVASGSTIA